MKPIDIIAPTAAAFPAAASKAEVAHDPDAAALATGFAAIPPASLSAEAAGRSSDVGALTLAASAGGAAESSELSADIVLLAHSVAIPTATHSKAPDAFPPMGRAKTGDVHSDSSLLKLLQRLQSKLKRGGNET